MLTRRPKSWWRSRIWPGRPFKLRIMRLRGCSRGSESLRFKLNILKLLSSGIKSKRRLNSSTLMGKRRSLRG